MPPTDAPQATAIRMFEASRNNGDSGRAWLGLSMAQSGKGEHEAALASALTVRTIAATVDSADLAWRASVRAGEALRSLQRLDEAQQEFRRAIAAIDTLAAAAPINPEARGQLDDSASAWTGLAFTLAAMSDARGALDAGRWIYDQTAIRRALIADITWATPYVRPGKGPAVSLRDAFVPRKVYFDRVRAAAERSGVKHQIEIESAGSSDGGMLERSGLGIDWVFVGASENGYHTATESLLREDAENMLRLYAHLVVDLSQEE